MVVFSQICFFIKVIFLFLFFINLLVKLIFLYGKKELLKKKQNEKHTYIHIYHSHVVRTFIHTFS